MRVGNHKSVWEYDGAFQCMECRQGWGALPNVPKEAPRICDVEGRIRKDMEKLRLHAEVYCKNLENHYADLKRELKKARNQKGRLK